MLSNNIIWPSGFIHCPCTKKDGSTQFCVNFKWLNAIIRKDAYPLHCINDTLATLAESKWFSTLDLISGYWQVEIQLGHRKKTAFCTMEDISKFYVQPFELCNYPSHLLVSYGPIPYPLDQMPLSNSSRTSTCAEQNKHHSRIVVAVGVTNTWVASAHTKTCREITKQTQNNEVNQSATTSKSLSSSLSSTSAKRWLSEINATFE